MNNLEFNQRTGHIKADQMADGIRAICRAQGLPVPETSYRFHHTRKWEYDLAWPEYMLALEIEGGAWVRGRHVRGQGYINDMEKYNEGTLQGWRILRVTPEQVKDGSVYGLIKRGMENEQKKVKADLS